MNRKDRRAEAARQRHAKAMVGMELRYGGRTLIVNVFVNTSESLEEVVKRVQPAARGSKESMILVTGAVMDTEIARPVWESQGITTMFEGKTVGLELYMNTDEEPRPISDRVMAAANTPVDPAVLEACKGRLAVVSTVSFVEPHEIRPMWERLFKGLSAQKDGPN